MESLASNRLSQKLAQRAQQLIMRERLGQEARVVPDVGLVQGVAWKARHEKNRRARASLVKDLGQLRAGQTRKDQIEVIRIIKTSVGRMPGMVMLVNSCQRFAPSMRADS